MAEYFFRNFLRVTLLKSDMGGIFNLEKVIAHNAWCTGQGWSLHFSLLSEITRVIFN